MGVGTSPKVRGPEKLRSRLEQKLTHGHLRYISTQFSAILVLANRFPHKIMLKKEGNYFKKILAENEGAMAPVAPPVPTPMKINHETWTKLCGQG